MERFIKYNTVIITGRGRLVAMAADCRSAYVSSILTPGSSIKDSKPTLCGIELFVHGFEAFLCDGLQNTQENSKEYYKIISLESFIQMEGDSIQIK